MADQTPVIPFSGSSSPVTGTPTPTLRTTSDFSGLPYRELAMMGARRQSLLFQIPSLDEMASVEDEGFDPFQNDYLSGYEAYAGRFIGITSESHATKIKERIASDQRDQSTLANAGFKGFFAEASGGIMNPSTFIPFVGQATRVGTMATNTARIGAGVALEEMVLQASQATRSIEESYMGVGSSVVLTGLMSAMMPKGSSFSPETQSG